MSRMVKGSISDKRLERCEIVSYVCIWGKTFQAEGTASAKASWQEHAWNIQERAEVLVAGMQCVRVEQR